MFSPLLIIGIAEDLNFTNFIFLFIASIMYDFYIYSIIQKEKFILEEKNHYYNFIKDSGKKLHIKISCEEKSKTLQDYIENLLKKLE